MGKRRDAFVLARKRHHAALHARPHQRDRYCPQHLLLVLYSFWAIVLLVLFVHFCCRIEQTAIFIPLLWPLSSLTADPTIGDPAAVQGDHSLDSHLVPLLFCMSACLLVPVVY